MGHFNFVYVFCETTQTKRKFQVKVKLPRHLLAVTSEPSLSSKPKGNFSRPSSTEASGSVANTSSSKPQPLRRSGRMRTVVLLKKAYIVLDQ